MRKPVWFLTLFLAVVAGVLGEEKIVGKEHDYDSEKLPEVIKVKAGDSIVVNFKNIKPKEVDECRVKSDNSDLMFKNEGTKANFQIIIRSDKVGKANVKWVIVLDSGITNAHKGQQVEFE
jgi:hypothetical protein